MPAVSHRLGRRGSLLLALGIILAVYGISILSAPAPPFAGFAPFGLDTRPLGLAWTACGLIAIVASGLRRVGTWDAVGYNALLVPPALWACLSAWSWVEFLAGTEPGNPRGWASATIWAGLIVIVLIVAGWPEPPREDA